jgi:hypothetical protein
MSKGCRQCAISVFLTNGYSPEHGVVNFKSHTEQGEEFERETARTRTGKVKLVRATKISPLER